MDNLGNRLEEKFVEIFVKSGVAEWFRIVPAAYCSKPITLVKNQIDFASLQPLILGSPMVFRESNRVDQVFNNESTAMMLLSAKVRQAVIVSWLN